MNHKTKTLIAAGVLAAIQAPNALAHLEPKSGDGMEKCYGVVKAGKNECASKANKHSCATMGRVDSDPNEWVKVPEGLCKKLTGGSLTAASEAGEESDDGHGDHDNAH